MCCFYINNINRDYIATDSIPQNDQCKSNDFLGDVGLIVIIIPLSIRAL